MEAVFNLSYDIADWLEYTAHFFQFWFLRDEHDSIWVSNKCADMRRFASVTQLDELQKDDAYEDIKDPLKRIFLWMEKEGVPDVPA